MAHDVAYGGLAMSVTTVGFSGEGVRGDCQVMVADSTAFRLDVRSSVEAMYGRAIRTQAQGIIDSFDAPQVEVTLDDSGALPWVIAARLESALFAHCGRALPKLARRTSAAQRQRRRWTRLYVPGNTPKFMQHVGLFGADSIILDLEDSVPRDEKAAALNLVRHAIATLEFGTSEVCVRVNCPDDASAVAAVGADCILVPKAESADQLRDYDEALDSASSDASIIAIIETARGIMHAFEIASASKRLAAISLGIEDFLTDIRAVRTESRQETAFAHGMIVTCARAAGIAPLASVFSNIDDDAGMFAYAQWSRQMGFEGVGCIHPSQIEAVNRAYRPEPEVIAEAQEIVVAYERAVSEGLGAIRVCGKMVDVPVYERAKRVLAEVQ